MHTRRVPWWLLFLALGSCSHEVETRQVFPRPVGGSAGESPFGEGEEEEEEQEEEEERQTALRKAWFEHRHRTAPEVDWRELERGNGEAQVVKRNRLSAGGLVLASPWVERGSENLAGRVHTAALAPDGSALYVGTALGGVWRGTTAGTGWVPLGDNLYGGAHHLAVLDGAVASAPDVLLVASSGGAVHVTRDAGASWQVPGGLGGSVNAVKRVLTSSSGSEAVLVLRRAGSNWRLMRSTDRLASFQSVLDLGTYAGDAWLRRDGSDDLYALTGTGLSKSVDLGTSWSPVGPVPAAGSDPELTGCEAGAPRLWSVIASGGQEKLYRSDDAGGAWTFVGNLSDYWGELAASIASPELFLYGGVEAHRTLDGGANFAVINAWSAYYANPASRLHADIQGIDVLPAAPFGESWFIATDGGLYRSQDFLGTVHNLSQSGLRISQYYGTHTSSAAPEHVVAGAQDQGYQRAGAPPPATGTTLAFTQLISGDYGHLTSGDGDHDYLFSVYPGFVLAQVGESNPSLFTIDFPSGEDHAWMPPVVADALDPRQFFLCASHLYRYTKGAGNNWSPAQWSSFDFGASAGEYVSALVFSPVDPQRAYAVTDRGRLFRSSDRGVTWTPSASTAPAGQYFYGTALLASRTDADTVTVAGSGYSNPAVWRSTDGGATFQSYSTGLPPTLVYCLGEAPDGSGTLFCGTETAAYRRDAGAASWTDVTGTGAPITVYWSVESLPHENSLRFATYGRGIWDYQLDVQARAVARNGSGVNPSCLSSLTEPELGTVWTVRIDAAPLPGAQRCTLIVRDSPGSGAILPQGELLIGGTRLYAVTRPAAPSTFFNLNLPADTALAGLTVFAQGALIGSEIRLCNALDVVLGF